MELWIRSQKNEEIRDGLYKVNEIELGDYNENMDCLVVNNLYCIGIYKSKERALEVLDEIQNMIKPILINTEYHSEIKQDTDKVSFDVVMTPIEDKITYIQPNVIVYEMPKE